MVALTPNPGAGQASAAPSPSTSAPEDWADPEVHDQVVGMIEAGLINAVQLDIKGENGEIGYDSKVRLGRRVGAVTEYYDAREAIDELHGLGVRVIGRIVNFLDPLLASWAWENGRPEMIVLDGERERAARQRLRRRPRSPTSPTRRSASTRSTWPSRPSASASTRSSTTTSADPKVIST